MKYIRVILITGMTMISSSLFAQSKGELSFTSTSVEAKKLVRDAWVAYADAKWDEGTNLVTKALEKDPAFGVAHASILSNQAQTREENLKKALSCPLSADEKLFIDGLVAAQRRGPVADYFEPLLKKYPGDRYLGLWVMLNYNDPTRGAEIGETIIKRSPKFAPAYNLLGYQYMAKSDWKKAEANFNKYISLRPDLANPYDSKAEYLMRIGKVEDAVPLYEKASAMGMSVAKGRAEMAKAKLKFGKPTDKDVQEIRGMIDATSAAYLKGDIDEVLKIYADQALEFLPNQVVNSGLSNIRIRAQNIFAYGKYTKFERSVDSITGVGDIALAWGKTQSTIKWNSSETLDERPRGDIFLLRKQQSGQWKILVHHIFIHDKEEAADNPSAIRQTIDKFSFFIKPNEVLSQAHVENLAAIYSIQGVDIMPDQFAYIGIGNLRVRWDGFKGIKWAQFTDLPFETNYFSTIGDARFANKAVAWGIGDHTFYPQNSDKLLKFLYPWAMILTKEQDGQWRILAYHFYTE